MRNEQSKQNSMSKYESTIPIIPEIREEASPIQQNQNRSIEKEVSSPRLINHPYTTHGSNYLLPSLNASEIPKLNSVESNLSLDLNMLRNLNFLSPQFSKDTLGLPIDESSRQSYRKSFQNSNRVEILTEESSSDNNFHHRVSHRQTHSQGRRESLSSGESQINEDQGFRSSYRDEQDRFDNVIENNTETMRINPSDNFSKIPTNIKPSPDKISGTYTCTSCSSSGKKILIEDKISQLRTSLTSEYEKKIYILNLEIGKLKESEKYHSNIVETHYLTEKRLDSNEQTYFKLFNKIKKI